jgi:hypothetical protein
VNGQMRWEAKKTLFRKYIFQTLQLYSFFVSGSMRNSAACTPVPCPSVLITRRDLCCRLGRRHARSECNSINNCGPLYIYKVSVQPIYIYIYIYILRSFILFTVWRRAEHLCSQHVCTAGPWRRDGPYTSRIRVRGPVTGPGQDPHHPETAAARRPGGPDRAQSMPRRATS